MHFKTRILALAMTGLLPLTAMAIGGPSGPKIDYHTQGHLGEVMMNPYGIAPLTAVIRDGGYTLEDVKVRIVPKQNGAEIAYKVSPSQVLTHGGIPVFGLYPNYVNTVEVSYTRIDGQGKKESFNDRIKLFAPPVYMEASGNAAEVEMPYGVEVKNPKSRSVMMYSGSGKSSIALRH